MKNNIFERLAIQEERGQSLMEFAMALTLMLVMVAGIVDLGRAFFTFIALRDAAQEGAVYGSYCPNDPDNIEARVRNASTKPIPLTDSSVVSVDCVYLTSGNACSSVAGTVNQGDGIQVTVTYDNFRLSMPLIGTFIGGQEFPIAARTIHTVLTTVCTP